MGRVVDGTNIHDFAPMLHRTTNGQKRNIAVAESSEQPVLGHHAKKNRSQEERPSEGLDPGFSHHFWKKFTVA